MLYNKPLGLISNFRPPSRILLELAITAAADIQTYFRKSFICGKLDNNISAGKQD